MPGVTKGVAEDEIVITGMSGRFPESNCLAELWSGLMAKEDMIKVDDRRWPVGVFEVDTFGKLKDISRFDAPFFNFSPKEADQCAPDVRIMLEVAWEAIVDAGYDPKSLENTPTGVYIGNCIVEAGEALTNNVNSITATGLLNSMHTSLPNKVSEYFRFTGPSETHDTGCSASLYSLDTAMMAMKRGDISAALIGGCNLNLKPQPTIALHRMNMVSKKRGCKVYDKSADGYSRAECISLVFLQWRSQARRIYGRIVNSVTNNDGFKEEGIIFPDSRSQISLLEEAYRGTCVKESDVCYVEAHGTGTQAGDTQECLAVDTFFCTKRDKDKPLLIGSIKSNLGHAEPASGVASLCKVLMSYTKGVIPPNILLNEINPKLEAVVQGRLKIVTEPTPLEGRGLVSLNAFGFGGSNAHVILLPNENEAKSKEVDVFFVNGRSTASVSNLLELAGREPKKGLQDLYRGLSTISPDLYPARGFLLLDQTSSVVERVVSQEGSETSGRQVWLLIGGLGSQWLGMGRGLMELEQFRRSVATCQTVLNDLGADVDIVHILCSEESDVCEDVVSMFVGLSALVIGLMDMLTVAGLAVDGVIGHSLGDTLCGYVLGLHTAGDIIKSAYARSVLISARRKELQGVMYGVGGCSGAGQSELVEGGTVACYNSDSHVTVALSGQSKEGAQQFLDKLNGKGYRVREVASGGFAFHSRAFSSVVTEVTGLMGYMESKARPESWLSTSYPAEEQPPVVGPRFFADNLVNPVHFAQNAKKIPEQSIVIELSGNSSLLGLLGGNHKKIGLVKYNKDARGSLLAGIGGLYVLGVLDTPYNLIPPPTYPTSRDTPSLSSAVAMGWNHDNKWWVPTLDEFLISSNEAKLNKFVSTYELCKSPANNPIDHFLEVYSILGRRILPLSVGVYLAWQSFARVNDVTQDNICVLLTHVTLHNQVVISSPITLSVGILPKSGQFHITTGDTLYMSGCIETHEALQECGGGFNTESEQQVPGEEVLPFYQLYSSSNRLITTCDMDTFSCTLDPAACDESDKMEDGILMILDSHFQLLQLERMSVAPFSVLAGASSIILNGREFCETDSISKPYPAACRSDAVWVDGAWFDALQPAAGEGVELGTVPVIVGTKEEEEEDEDKGEGGDTGMSEMIKLQVPPNILYCHLLGSCFWLNKRQLTVTSVHPTFNGQFHVCYATCCRGDVPCCRGDVPCYQDNKHVFAVGILSKREVLDSTGFELSQQFFTVNRGVFCMSPEGWAAVAISLCLLKVLQLSKPDSVLVIGDGDTLYNTFKQILATRARNLQQTFLHTKKEPLQDLLGQTDTAGCAVNLSTERHFLDILAATSRCGKAVNLVRHDLQDDCGMSSLLKNISVINFRTNFIKLSTYWDTLRAEMRDWADDSSISSETMLPLSDIVNTTLIQGTTLQYIYVTVHLDTAYIEKVFRHFFQHRPNFVLTFCGKACTRDISSSRDIITPRCVTLVMSRDSLEVDCTAQITEDTCFTENLSLCAVRSWLWYVCSRAAPNPDINCKFVLKVDGGSRVLNGLSDSVDQ